MLTLWDMLRPIAEALRPKPAPAARPPKAPPRAQRIPTRERAKEGTPPAGEGGMQARYDAMVREMQARYGFKIRKWRTNSSGIARLTQYADGTVVRTLESPRPAGPMSAAIFLHEVGHHAIGFGTYSPRCLEEYHAWAFALREMERLELNITEAVRTRMHRSLKYAIDKARRRGLRELPPELAPFDSPPPPRRRRRAR